MTQEINPYLEPIEELREIFSQLLDEPQVFPNEDVANWNRNVDLYYKWIDGGDQPPTPDPDPDPSGDDDDDDDEGDDDLGEDIIISRNEAIKVVRNIKKEYINRDKNQKIINADHEITEEEWTEWEAEEAEKYVCLDEVEQDIFMLPVDVLKEEWTLCTQDLPTNYVQVMTCNNKGIIGMHYLDSDSNWKNWFTGEVDTTNVILGWMHLPAAIERES